MLEPPEIDIKQEIIEGRLAVFPWKGKQIYRLSDITLT
jgi:hypothetical protein